MKTVYCLPLLLCLLLAACTKNEINVKFELPEDVNTPCRIVYYASSDKVGMIRETVAEIAGGKGELKLPTRYPSIVYLFLPSQKEPAAVFYAGRGDKMLIKGNSADVREWDISGNAISEELSEWRLENKEVLKGSDEQAVNRIVAKYVKDNPSAQLSLLMLTVYYSRRIDPDGFRKLYASLDKKAFDNKNLVSALAAADLLDGPGAAPAVPDRLVLRGEEGYADTLLLNDTVRTMIVFRNGKEDNGIPLEDLKSLSAGKGRVAEVYMDADTIGWKRHLKRDTIPGLKRLMMPQGLADSAAMAMGVRRIPYYIVTGGKKRVLYSGDDWKKASDTYKK